MRETPTDLTNQEIELLLNAYKDWKLDAEDGISFFRFEKEFSDFKTAFSFITKLALVSEALDHHAEIWNVYNQVKLKVFTHETNSLTTKDKELITNLMN
ncbi:4a-hydroxytetrahydrobiopterin dehydratase [Leptospira brenneri]|uniref:4a-hydroxytetrahydrobiopterin dehydratase n=1 Tax=Leptospira brenneri TaxID=2023182 RepID=A0A2M9XZ60_9LEPT|nr:4a-hydroxytetrahydrobiopterin dehydratase [Leptospira brenneri]PJZ44620.1 4a-hydroxytetrahydrobiopterin dehydratase [Leptospira brenneri]TGK96858.1 4a-hydroxytetrahydrobiopterin dehydratase [Leptospira brenneri]